MLQPGDVRRRAPVAVDGEEGDLGVRHRASDVDARRAGDVDLDQVAGDLNRMEQRPAAHLPAPEQVERQRVPPAAPDDGRRARDVRVAGDHTSARGDREAQCRAAPAGTRGRSEQRQALRPPTPERRAARTNRLITAAGSTWAPRRVDGVISRPGQRRFLFRRGPGSARSRGSSGRRRCAVSCP